MHSYLGVDKILELVVRELVASEAKGTAVSLACCCRNFEGPVLDQLWETQDRIIPLLKCLPQEVWKEEQENFVSQLITLHSLDLKIHLKVSPKNPTTVEWASFLKYTRRMRILEVDPWALASEILLSLQLRTANGQFLPRLQSFKCKGADEDNIPFFPLFLSPATTSVYISFFFSLQRWLWHR